MLVTNLKAKRPSMSIFIEKLAATIGRDGERHLLGVCLG
jgi:hypothetical protein